ncbi:DUF2797 domain-containing protein [Streptomyces bambusae]|uniref:DUF2797 domain-containing protein n=1 Tax=Streptomyces bambusae TaxID=1550616 RepID=UPI001CFD53DF|nr:DUF2797 domain-containing protein [Streptomyces bambusae]MCB5168910.1 DUF2797 domain-containing protein [Streptomyces bambusae]
MWRCAGVRWGPEGPRLRWDGAARGTRESPLRPGQRLGFVLTGERRCLGVWRSGRHTPCPRAAAVGARAGSAQCPECARLDRSFSVAADTNVADPRPYRVYLAWFGPGLVKVGITAEERGADRLLEQAAVAYGWLGRGPLMAARRTEELLRAALGVPDRIPYARKRAVRAALPPWPERAAEVADLHARALALAGWAETLERLPCVPVDHTAVFGLDRIPAPLCALGEPAAGAVVAGELAGAAGPDLHLADGLVVDTRLLAGWELTAAAPDAVTSVAVVPVGAPVPPAGEQDGLF